MQRKRIASNSVDPDLQTSRKSPEPMIANSDDTGQPTFHNNRPKTKHILHTKGKWLATFPTCKVFIIQ